MIKGFQQRISYKGLSFAVDTVDMGIKNPQLISSLTFEGIQIASEKIPYDDIIKFDRLEQVLEDLMVELNKKVKTLLLDGFYDALIEKYCTQKSDEELTPIEAVKKIVMPFIQERFGTTIAQKIGDDVISEPYYSTGSDKAVFTQLCQKILDFRIGHTPVFPLMFGENTEALMKEWVDEFNTLTYSSFTASEISALDAIQKHVLPELQNMIGKYMTYKVWDTVQSKKVSIYGGLGEGDKFLKLCQDVLAYVTGFYSEEEQGQKIRYWHEQAYPNKLETASKPSINASDAVWKIVHPDIAELLGKYIADKLVLEAIEKVPSRGRYEYGKFIDVISIILTNDLIVNLCDDHWIEKRRNEWKTSFELLSVDEVSPTNLS